MIQDVFVPTKIGSYYIFYKKILAIEVTTTSVQASLLYFVKNKVMLENSMMIEFSEYSQTTVIQAIKKITSTIGQYDELITSLTSSAVIFKELTLPFIGREKIKMIVSYEVEPLLPFPLEEAVIDFIITDENKDKQQTTILVAAALKSDLDTYLEVFEKAGISVHNVTLDIFALYDFYRHTMYVAQSQTSLLLIDFGIDSIKILYVSKGILRSVRLVPYGLAKMLQGLLVKSVPADESMEDILEESEYHPNNMVDDQAYDKVVADFCKQVSLSLGFFQKQIKNFIQPVKIICLGQGSLIRGFSDKVQSCSDMNVETLDIKKIAHYNSIESAKKSKIEGKFVASLMIGLSQSHDEDINFLSQFDDAAKDRLFAKQILIALGLSVVACVGLYFYSNYQIQKWTSAYDKSKKEMVTLLAESMDLDVKNIKRVSEIVESAKSRLQQTKKVCFSFSEKNRAFLHHLQELGSKIDRVSLGLDLKKMSMKDKEIILQGKVKDFEALETFEEELMELKGLELKDRPRELVFTVSLFVQDDQDKNKDDAS
jgi:type IV pilus assembly protein PilM